ncbi:MAG: diguanylate cyclase [Firmicutes bacterium]|nr:diguanylate cyclase [Bacillota bacterium]
MTRLLRPAVFWKSAEAAIMTRGTRPWVIGYCDLDDFKQVNDPCGHAVGNAVLRAWGQIFREEARSADIIGRLGGAEVGWWMPENTEEAAQRAVERVLRLCQIARLRIWRALPFLPA